MTFGIVHLVYQHPCFLKDMSMAVRRKKGSLLYKTQEGTYFCS